MHFSKVARPLLVPLNHRGDFSTPSSLQALPRRMLPCARLAPHTIDLLVHMWVTKPLTYVSATLPLVGGQW